MLCPISARPARRVLGLTLAALLGLAALTAATSPTAARPTADAELEELMEGLKTNLKGLAGTLRDPGQDERSLRYLAEMQQLALAAKLLAPSNLEELEEDRRPEHLKDFRRDMARLLRELVDMELHVLDGANDAAFESVVTTLFKLREDSHAKYQEK